MKKLLILACCAIALLLVVSCATGYHGAVEDYIKVVEAPNTSASELFVRANSWMVDAFKNSESVIQYSDKEAGIIKGKFVSKVPVGLYTGVAESTITVETKDNKARIMITYGNTTYNAVVYYSTMKFNVDNMSEDTWKAYDLNCQALILSFENAMQTQVQEW